MKVKKVKKITIYTAGFDGSAKPNPGPIRIGGWIRKYKDKELIHTFSIDAGYGSNIEAEYLALITLLKVVDYLKIEYILIVGDCLPIIRQVNKKSKAKKVITQKYRDIALNLLKNKNWALRHIKRHRNREADNLSHLIQTQK